MSSETTPPSGAQLADALMRTTHALRRYAGQPYQQRGWSTSRVLLMLAVDEAGTPRMGELKDRLGVTGRSITSLVDGLEDEGLLRRCDDPGDRRSTRLEITAKGREHLGEIKALHDAHAEHTFAVLGAAERSALLDTLGRLRDHVAGRLPEPGEDAS
ncbi:MULTISPECIES: MarR family winged helix-turn-helix transcriptional regulator [unclassified Amycolatopsis]|uniref:MarR family winged helix-turn-helix transcriptional regulator n=1 Tax=unclassified Amycolatopsis TaxID=2618356 RepID=UPI001FF4839F|nr:MULTISPECIES: MarR family winged helix-turn-helix transcriptional regulator [unclassified Amycolatopsis]UOZ03678.1 MarR family winged helix-turn-helix transcriptional regulator [Amycolatopsis sp. WQ 127309]WSK77399.1 MarR family winged helix-turn-helix transcriptional regulator [Amycolatopsis sp. NBC_01286]